MFIKRNDELYESSCLFFLTKKSSCSPGGELIKLIQERYGQPYPPQQVLKMFYQTCRAVAHMHKQTPPVIHRDLKVSTSKHLDNKLPNVDVQDPENTQGEFFPDL